MSHDQSFLHPDAQAYALSYLRPPFPTMEALEREIAASRQPAVGRMTGSLLRTLVASAGPAKRIVEVGCNVGYSALWMASALAPGGELHTIEIDPQIARRAEANFKAAGVGDRVQVHVGAALDVLPRLAGPFDVAFFDAVKAEYVRYLELTLPKLRRGGVIAADNMFWLGQAWGDEKDDDSLGVRAYMKRISEDPRLVSTLAPSEDGLALSVVRA